MKNTHKLDFIRQEGEGYLVEFKEKISNLDREIVAFANGAGGSVFLGIKDSGAIIGIEIDNRLKSQVMDIAYNCDPSIRITLHVYRKERVLEIMVAEGNDKPYRCRDGFFMRQEASSQKLKRDEIGLLLLQSPKVRFDETLNTQFRYPEDFSEEAMHFFLKQAGIDSPLSMESILLNLNVAEKNKNQIKLRQAGVLFFAKEPQNFLVESYITAVAYASNDKLDVLDKKDFLGSPLRQIEETLLFLKRHINTALTVTASQAGALGARQETYDYPLVALREAVVNAVVHRDYFYDASHIYVHLYPNYIEIENPGGLYPGITLESLTQRSVRRNRLLADLLHQAGYIERIGSGFARIKQALNKNNNPPFEISATNFFNIRFYKRLSYELELNLTSRQIKLLQLFSEHQGLTKGQVAKGLLISEDTALRELNKLIEKKMIKREGIGKATCYSKLI